MEVGFGGGRSWGWWLVVLGVRVMVGGGWAWWQQLGIGGRAG